jgi:hypothetical protein
MIAACDATARHNANPTALEQRLKIFIAISPLLKMHPVFFHQTGAIRESPLRRR